MDFYLQESDLIDRDYYIQYIQLDPSLLQALGSMLPEELRLLELWILLCQKNGLNIQPPYNDMLILYQDIPMYLDALEVAYNQLSGKTLSSQTRSSSLNPYQKMHNFLKEAQKNGKGIIGIAD